MKNNITLWEIFIYLCGVTLGIMISILLIIGMANFGSALYSGESIIVASNLDNISGVVFVENTSAINYIQLNDSAISITIPETYDAGEFKIVFYGYTTNNPNQKEKEIVYVGGGGGHTIYKNITQNITKEVPVDKIIYQDRNITQIEYVDKSERPKWLPEWFNYIWLSLIFLLLSYFTYFILKMYKGGKQNENQ